MGILFIKGVKGVKGCLRKESMLNDLKGQINHSGIPWVWNMNITWFNTCLFIDIEGDICIHPFKLFNY